MGAVLRNSSNSAYRPDPDLASGPCAATAPPAAGAGRALGDDAWRRGRPPRPVDLHGPSFRERAGPVYTDPTSALMPPASHDPCTRAPPPPPARGPPARVAPLRLPVPGDRGLPRRAGGAGRPLSRPVRRSLLPYVDLTVFLLVGARSAAYVRAGRRARPAAAPTAACPLQRSASPGWRSRCSPADAPRRGSSRSSTCGWGSSGSSPRPGVDPRELRRSRPARRGACSAWWGRGRRSGPSAGGSSPPPRPPLRRREPPARGGGSCSWPPPCLVGALWRRRPLAVDGSQVADADARARAASRKASASSSALPTCGRSAALIATSSFVTALSGWQLKAMAQQALVTRTPSPPSSAPSTPGSASPASPPRSC